MGNVYDHNGNKLDTTCKGSSARQHEIMEAIKYIVDKAEPDVIILGSYYRKELGQRARTNTTRFCMQTLTYQESESLFSVDVIWDDKEYTFDFE